MNITLLSPEELRIAPGRGGLLVPSSRTEMCEWPAHPNEFGAPPDEIGLIDTRNLFWLPTDDERQLWLFRYC